MTESQPLSFFLDFAQSTFSTIARADDDRMRERAVRASLILGLGKHAGSRFGYR